MYLRLQNKGSSVMWKPLAVSGNFHDVKVLITAQLQCKLKDEIVIFRY